MSVAGIDEMLASLLKNEGGYVNHPNDPGGETNYGITVGTARANGYQGDMRSMKRDDATSIYRRIYFERPGYDQVFAISPGISAELFDTGVNMGPNTASQMLQRALNALNRDGADYADVTTDGELGPASISALKTYISKRGDEGESVLLKALNCLQGARYLSLAEKNPKLESFVYGWLANRVDMSI